MKLEEKNKARELRYQGLSIQQISTSLGVSKGSVSAWVRDIEIPEELLINIGNRQRLGREHSRIARLSNITKANLELNAKCKEEILPFSKRDLWIAGIMLYAGEGYKTNNVSNQRIELANSDPNILRVFINFLIYICKIPKLNIRVRLILYEDINIKDAHKYWSHELDIPLKQFQNPFIKKSYRDIPSRHRRRVEFGTAHINVYDVKIYRKIVAWLQAIYGYNNLDFNKLGE